MTTQTAWVFATPNKTLMNSALPLIHNHLKSLRLDFLPYLQEKILPLQNTVTLADQIFHEALGKVLAQLQNTDLNMIDRGQARTEVDASLSETQRQELRQRWDRRRIEKLAALKAVLLTAADTMTRRIDDLIQINLQLPDDGVESNLQRQLDTLADNKASLADRLGTVAEDRRLLNETIKTYEQRNLVKTFQDLLPTAQELSQLAIPSVELALIQAATARLQTLLGKLSDSITYQELTAERDKLDVRYSELLGQSRRIDGEARTISSKLEQLVAVASLNNTRNIWAVEARKAPDALYAFLETYLSGTAARLPAQQQLDELRKYIESFHSVWREL